MGLYDHRAVVAVGDQVLRPPHELTGRKARVRVAADDDVETIDLGGEPKIGRSPACEMRTMMSVFGRSSATIRRAVPISSASSSPSRAAWYVAVSVVTSPNTPTRTGPTVSITYGRVRVRPVARSVTFEVRIDRRPDR